VLLTNSEAKQWLSILTLLYIISGKPPPLIVQGLSLELELIQTRMIQKSLLWVEVGKIACVLVCLWGFANCTSLRLLDMTRNAPHFWTFSLSGLFSGAFNSYLTTTALQKEAE
jgi:hypothetical protein